jgi:hypothetical protein
MGTRIQNLANNFTTAGIVKAAAINDASVSAITAIPSGLGGALTLIKSVTASASATISFVDGTDGVVLDGTYSSYIFKFIDIHPETDDTHLQFNFSTDGGSNYNVTKTTTAFRAYHDEADTATILQYQTGDDLAQSTSFQRLSLGGLGNDNDQSTCGYLKLFNPSSTTFVKHFIARSNIAAQDNFSLEGYVAGYGNTTSAVNAVQFSISSGNIDDGIIKLYGVS